jgi:hypothetical protein
MILDVGLLLFEKGPEPVITSPCLSWDWSYIITFLLILIKISDDSTWHLLLLWSSPSLDMGNMGDRTGPQKFGPPIYNTIHVKKIQHCTTYFYYQERSPILCFCTWASKSSGHGPAMINKDVRYRPLFRSLSKQVWSCTLYSILTSLAQ